VLAKTGGRYRVLSEGAVVEATLRGRLKQGQEQVLVGDRVTLCTHADGAMTIEEVGERRSVLRRRTPGRSHGVRLVAANVDQVAVVGAARQPDWAPPLMDRFLAVAAANALPVVVAVSKCDLIDDPSPLGRPYELAGYEVLYTSVPVRSGLTALRDRLAGRITLFSGPTGVGKSSLLNALQPGLRLRTGAVSRRSHGGRHTTVSAEMYAFAHGGFVVDTPGLRDIGLWGLERSDVEAAFPEFRCHAEHCRFDDCHHIHEPGCAVVVAAQRGDIAESRLDSYRRMLQEAHAAARPWAAGKSR
jgi:ribosome biogenesis GTPase